MKINVVKKQDNEKQLKKRLVQIAVVGTPIYL